VVQLRILNGKKAGTDWTARRFPVRIGRAATSDLALEEDGVWDQHLELSLDSNHGVLLSVQPEAFAAVNGQPVQQVQLRSGDLIEIGALQLRFGLSAARHRGLRLRETLTWLALGALCVAQVALIYWLAQ
jgi:pSer/pThr/pTyr-binding forkhead associated (FHA) protein